MGLATTSQQMTTLAQFRSAAQASKAWPFAEARKLVSRMQRRGQTPSQVLFETGYGPSGLPHIGTFGEVARTTMVRHAFETLSDVPTRLICFSDDMDGLRKVPDNIPNRDLIAGFLGKQLTKIPDPFGEYESYGHHNNAMLRRFLDRFGFEYEFLSSTEYYESGRFDAALRRVLEVYDQVLAVMLPSLREERASTYSPFLPIHPRSGVVMQVPIEERRLSSSTIVWRDPASGERFETPVTGGHSKLQWKPDWGMRWYALGVDYEMSGKDLSDSVRLSAQICRVLGGEPPEGFTYELFLDEKGQKISKSKGNGLAIDEWLRYASPESLQLFMYHKPREAKRLYFDVIPRYADEYFAQLAAYRRQDEAQRLANPVWHVHAGGPPDIDMPVSFSLLLNLVSACNASDHAILWGFIRRYAPGTSPETHPAVDRLVSYAINYFNDFVKPAKKYRAADEVERAALEKMSTALALLPQGATGDDIQALLYDIGRGVPRYHDRNAKGATPERPGVSLAWFNALYQILLGEERGPRFGPFVALYGVEETRRLIDDALAGKFLTASQAA
jgi:lysyl-tRNA synthetase class 1